MFKMGGTFNNLWQNYWTTYGLSLPEEITKSQRCPTMGTHGQTRMIPSARYSARQTVEPDIEKCPLTLAENRASLVLQTLVFSE